MDLFERKKLWCPVCGEKLSLKTTPGGLSKRETICYFECTGCGLTTGKRLTVDEAVDAAVPSEAAKAVTSSEEEGQDETRPGGDKNPFPTVGLAEMGRYWLRANELMHSLDHRILLDRERKGYGPTYVLRFIRRTDGWRETVKDEDGNVVKDEDGNDVTHDVRKVTWLATYSSQEIPTMQWEGNSVLDTLEKMAADVSEWEAENAGV